LHHYIGGGVGASFDVVRDGVADALLAAHFDLRPRRAGTFHNVILQSKHQLMTASIVPM
jgi:hypothetical protein